MKLIENFKQDSFLKTIWVSDNARKVWEPTINKCSQLVQELEIDSVEAGHRKCAWRSVHEDEFLKFTDSCVSRGLVVLPVKYTGLWEGFSHKTLPVISGKPKNIYTIIAREMKDAIKFKNYFELSDHNGQGKMLGFPKCCRDSFIDNWGKGYFDPIWQIGKKDVNEFGNFEILDLYGDKPGYRYGMSAHPYSNPVLRYIGLRVGFHIPCTFNCKCTIELSEKRLNLAKEKKPDVVKLLEALLSMPMSWDVLHGIAVVKTPIFYIITSSVPSTEIFKLDINGDFLPRESKKGTEFPFTKVT